MQKVILFYKFIPLADPKVVMLWQKTLTDSLGLKGRIIISKDGINGTVGGNINEVKCYIKANKRYQPFKNIVYKWSDGQGNDFPKMSVKVRDELVTFNALGELEVNENGVIGGGKKLKPAELNELVEKRPNDVVMFDGRSLYEAKVGKFKNAVTPNVRTAKDFIPIIESGQYDDIKDKAVVTYCTGGIRCEILTKVMKNRGFKEVYQLDGGIVKYGETYGDKSLWEGSLYVFDGRMGLKFSDESKDIGECIHCQSKTSNYENCANKSCNDLVLICSSCVNHKTHCQKCISQNKIKANLLKK